VAVPAQDVQPDDVHGEAENGDHQHQAAFDLLRIFESRERLPHDQEG
jgi:hypothetical protein